MGAELVQSSIDRTGRTTNIVATVVRRCLTAQERISELLYHSLDLLPEVIVQHSLGKDPRPALGSQPIGGQPINILVRAARWDKRLGSVGELCESGLELQENLLLKAMTFPCDGGRLRSLRARQFVAFRAPEGENDAG